MPNLPFGFERPEDSPGFLLWQTTVVWQRQIKKALEAYEISHAQFVLMALLLWLEKSSADTLPNQITLVKLSQLDKMTVSQALKKLVQTDFIQRAEHTEDTRAKSVVLTSKGKDLMMQLIPLVEKIDAEFFSVISPEKQQLLTCLLNELTRSLL